MDQKDEALRYLFTKCTTLMNFNQWEHQSWEPGMQEGLWGKSCLRCLKEVKLNQLTKEILSIKVDMEDLNKAIKVLAQPQANKCYSSNISNSNSNNTINSHLLNNINLQYSSKIQFTSKTLISNNSLVAIPNNNSSSNLHPNSNLLHLVLVLAMGLLHFYQLISSSNHSTVDKDIICTISLTFKEIK